MQDKHGATVTLCYEHHQIHHGNLWTITDVDASVDIAGPKYWMFRTPATHEFHMTIKATADAGAIARLFQAPTVSGDGSALDIVNRNFLAEDRSSGAFAFYDTTVSADGTQKEVWRIGAGSHPLGRESGGERGREIILKKSTDYVLKVTTEADGTAVELEVLFYFD